MRNRHHALVLLIITVLTWIFALNTGRRLAYQLAYTATALGVASFGVAWTGVRGLRIARYTPTRRVHVGQVVEEQISITNQSWFPKLWIEVQDFSTLPGHRVGHVVPALRPKRTYRWFARTVALERGAFRLGPMVLRSSDPFGIFTFRRVLPQTQTVLVYPYIAPIPYLPLPHGRLAGGEVVRERTPYLTTNLAGVREYQPGDAFNRIHWRTTARVGRLMSKEFEKDPLADVWLVLDMHRDVYVGQRHFDTELPVSVFSSRQKTPLLPAHSGEYAIALAASVAAYILRQKRSLGFLTLADSRYVIPPDRGERHLHKMLDILARVEAVSTIPLERVLLSEMPLFGRHTTLLVITGDWTGRWVPPLAEAKRRGIMPLVILVDGSTFGPVPPPNAALNVLVRQGIPTFIVHNGDPFERVFQARGSTYRGVYGQGSYSSA